MRIITTALLTGSALLLLTACGSTGVVPMDNGTYYVSEMDGWHYGSPDAETISKAYTKARTVCSKQGKTVQSINKQVQVGAYGVYPSFSLEFRCVNK